MLGRVSRNSLLGFWTQAHIMFNFQLLTCLVVASAALAAPASGNSDSAVFSSLSSSVSSVVTSALSSVLPSSSVSAASSVVQSSSGSSVSSAPSQEQTVAPASNDPNFQVFPQGTNETPEAINGKLGATIIFPDNTELNQQNPDLIAPPSTDHGSV